MSRDNDKDLERYLKWHPIPSEEKDKWQKIPILR